MVNSATQDRDSATAGAAGFLPASGLVAGLTALAGASCCALPLILAISGVGGAWVANLGVLVAYRPWFLAIAVAIIALGWLVAAVRGSRGRTIVVLALATAAVAAAFAVTAYEVEITRYLAGIWRAQ